MELTKVIKAYHGKAAIAYYKIGKSTLEVILQHNKNGKNKWGKLHIVTNFIGKRKVFKEYSLFRQYRILCNWSEIEESGLETQFEYKSN